MQAVSTATMDVGGIGLIMHPSENNNNTVIIIVILILILIITIIIISHVVCYTITETEAGADWKMLIAVLSTAEFISVRRAARKLAICMMSSQIGHMC